ncbi:MAG TPA: ubiquitin-like domain-containing protein [bacterium]|nr:ubiquitin-like domain-containing protein [bacterium]
MAPAVSPSTASDIRVLKDQRRCGSAYLAYLLVACFVSGLLAPFISVPRLWHLVLGQNVYLSIDRQTRAYSTLRRTVADVLKENKIVLSPEDRVDPPVGTAIWPGIQISVVRALPLVMSVGGTPRSARVAAQTVGEALALLNIQVRGEDRVYPDPSTALAPDMRITIERRETRTWVVRRPVAFPSRIVADPTLLKGTRAVRSDGRPGLLDRTVRVEYADGRAVTVQTLAEAVVTPPTPRVIAVGTKPLLAASGPYAGKEIMVLQASAYYPGPNNFGGGVGPKTAIGLIAQHGVVAVDPSVIPLGTRLFIEGYGAAVAGDTGGAIRGTRVDLCFNTYQEAMQFGRRNVKVYILAWR